MIYCKNCEYFLRIDGGEYGTSDFCTAKENTDYDYAGDERLIAHPKIINKDNDCTYFKKELTFIERLKLLCKPS